MAPNRLKAVATSFVGADLSTGGREGTGVRGKDARDGSWASIRVPGMPQISRKKAGAFAVFFFGTLAVGSAFGSLWWARKGLQTSWNDPEQLHRLCFGAFGQGMFGL